MGFLRSISTVKIKTVISRKYVHVTRVCLNNTGGTYRMLNLSTKHIVRSHDIIWRNKTYGEYVSRK